MFNLFLIKINFTNSIHLNNHVSKSNTIKPNQSVFSLLTQKKSIYLKEEKKL